jgi:hypothetical protein
MFDKILVVIVVVIVVVIIVVVIIVVFIVVVIVVVIVIFVIVGFSNLAGVPTANRTRTDGKWWKILLQVK